MRILTKYFRLITILFIYSRGRISTGTNDFYPETMEAGYFLRSPGRL